LAGRWAARAARTTPISPAPATQVASARAMPLPRACRSAAVPARHRASSSRAQAGPGDRRRRARAPSAPSPRPGRPARRGWRLRWRRRPPDPSAEHRDATTTRRAGERMAPAAGVEQSRDPAPRTMLAPRSIVIVVLLARPPPRPRVGDESAEQRARRPGGGRARARDCRAQAVGDQRLDRCHRARDGAGRASPGRCRERPAAPCSG